MNLPASLPLLVLALTVEAALGYPQRFYAAIGHPVTWIGRLIGMLDRSLNHETASFVARKTVGILALVLLLAVTVTLSALVQHMCLSFGPLGLIPLAMLASTLIAQRSLYEHVARVAEGFQWQTVLRPLVDFVADARHAPDLAAGGFRVPGVGPVTQVSKRGLRHDLGRAVHYVRTGGVRALAQKVRARFGRR